ncbi:GNAT family N-acetyltransferase [Levilactobacillus tangyuanensis]|uniref:GNAT family N-acetyltransferase n=1 Tax=Levilactobacillus tangyuanensis TaxID=2486021 RepID=A0ABW1TKK2_9LACO|nr:GNAT family N-acetyltransferase [Levilactobacillus tangyuanensis]
MEIVISSAPFNRAAALSLRQAIFVTERGIPRDIEFDDRDTPDRLYVTAYQTPDTPIGTLRLEPLADHQMRFGRICTSRILRGQGVGTQVLGAAEKWAREHGYLTGIVHGEVTAGPFPEDGAPVVVLQKSLD